MKLICEICGEAQPSSNCEHCQQPAPLWAKYCPHCGQPIAAKRTKSETKTKRQLCSDESCIGIIGPDGVCTDCGKRPAA